MAKDPATLWYWNDWHSGTILMSRFLKGCYMDLLHAQFNHGPLSLEEVKAVLGGDFGQAWPSLQKKFSENQEGLFFNERLELERQKRIKHSEHQKLKANKRWHSPGNAAAYATGMPLENENENENRIEVSGIGGMGERDIERCAEIAMADKRWVKANKLVNGELLKFNEYLEKQGKYIMNPLDYKTYFAKLKGRYPDLLKKTFTIEELREIAKQQDLINERA